MKKLLAVLLCAVMVFSLVACGDKEKETNDSQPTQEGSATDEGNKTTAPETEQATATGEETGDATETAAPSTVDKTLVIADNAVDFAKNMKAGWNLGNTLDAPSETAWGAPKTDLALFAGLKELGFTTVRIPISWSKHVTKNDDGTYTINDEWMARVKEVVTAAYDAELIVIINSHHDNDVYYPTKENLENATLYISSIWTQIAEAFKDYDERLMFESLNEPRLAGTSKEWYFGVNDPDGVAAIECINSLNQTFVDVVRASEGYNKTRFLGVPSHAASGDYPINGGHFVMPTDTIENHLLLSVHAYSPYDFCMHFNGGIDEWDGNKHMPGINSYFDNLETRFISQGYGVYVGETGCTNKKDDQTDRIAWAKDFTAACKAHGVGAIWWDNMQVNKGDENFGLISRYTFLALFEDLQQAFVNGMN